MIKDGSGLSVLPIGEDDPVELSDLVGKVVTNIGFAPGVEGGLTIDYAEKEGKTKRIILGFTELGMWTAWSGILK
jgi:hypothetical protein